MSNNRPFKNANSKKSFHNNRDHLEFIKDKAEYSIGDADMRKMLGDNIVIFSYPQLENVNDIDEIFDDEGRSVMLLLTTDQYTGHWLCMIKKDDDIHYFDPYGNMVDEDKKWMTWDKLEELGQEKPLLINLLKKSNKRVYYNTYPFQADRKDINTCGRHIAVRLLYKNLDLDDYFDMIQKSNLTPDHFVTEITYKILKK
jgi:hypothetical protein